MTENNCYGDGTLYHPSRETKPLEADEINKAFEIARNILGYRLAGYRRKCFRDGVRFAERHHGITPAEQDPEPVKEVMHTLLGTNR